MAANGEAPPLTFADLLANNDLLAADVAHDSNVVTGQKATADVAIQTQTAWAIHLSSQRSGSDSSARPSPTP